MMIYGYTFKLVKNKKKFNNIFTQFLISSYNFIKDKLLRLE